MQICDILIAPPASLLPSLKICKDEEVESYQSEANRGEGNSIELELWFQILIVIVLDFVVLIGVALCLGNNSSAGWRKST